MARTEKGIGKRELSVVFTEITPPHGWKQDEDYHYLRLTLPGNNIFKFIDFDVDNQIFLLFRNISL